MEEYKDMHITTALKVENKRRKMKRRGLNYKYNPKRRKKERKLHHTDGISLFEAINARSSGVVTRSSINHV